MSTPATRLLTLLLLLQRRPNQKAAELAAELDVSVRTVHRYIGMLEEMGIPLYSERGPNGGFSLVPGYRMPPLVFTPEEAVAVYLGTSLAEQMWGRLYRSAAAGALAKLDNVLPYEQRQEVAWANRALVATGMHRADYDAISHLLEGWRSAIHEGQRLRIGYRARQRATPTPREVDPYALVHRSGWWYGVAYCHLRDGLRTFRIDRITFLNPCPQTFKVPSDFDVHAYLATAWSDQPQMVARARFIPEGVAIALDNRAFWDTLEEQPDGSLIVTFSVSNLPWAAGVVLSYGGLAIALDPPELRATVQEWAAYMANQYGDEPTETDE